MLSRRRGHFAAHSTALMLIRVSRCRRLPISQLALTGLVGWARFEVNTENQFLYAQSYRNFPLNPG
jgi:hypothetical protein